MRCQITGLNQAAKNVKDGIGFIQTGEGALAEIHTMLNRLTTLAIQSANSIYATSEREKLDAELKSICGEIDRIAQATNFNGIRLFGEIGAMRTTVSENGLAVSRLDGSGETLKLDDLLADDGPELKNIIFVETVNEVQTTQAGVPPANAYSGEWADAAGTLKTQIVPQAVQGILKNYPAFSYLTGSSIGIGLRLYSEPASTTLATVRAQVSGPLNNLTMTYELSVNMGRTDLSTAAGRSALEQTICHEMIHALMDEATTSGMLGIASSGASGKTFPQWFKEGMAQTASGPDNWIRSSGGLGLSPGSSAAAIGAALAAKPLSSGESNTAVQYGTGYLACMYLGYLAAGQDVSMGNAQAASAALAQGVSDVLQCLVAGQSLDWTIDYVSGGKYKDVDAFEKGFASDGDAHAFIRSLLPYVAGSSVPNGGGLVAGSLSATDPLSDADLSVALFSLNNGYGSVSNSYPAGYQVLSGGMYNAGGPAPQSGIPIPVLGRSRALKQGDIFLQVSPDVYGRFAVPRYCCSCDALRLDKADITTQQGALQSLGVIKGAIDTVSAIRGGYGALQNALEHIYNNLLYTAENISEAESRIRDTDMADEMMEYTKGMILARSARAMLVHANLVPRSVLRLVR